MNFRFKEKSSPHSWVNATVKSLHKYPMEEVLSAPRLITEWKPELINSLEEHLVPEKIRVQIVAKAFEADADSVESWYGTKYRKERVPDKLIEKWNNAGLNDAFQLPEKNEFIPSLFDIKPCEKVLFIFQFYFYTQFQSKFRFLYVAGQVPGHYSGQSVRTMLV